MTIDKKFIDQLRGFHDESYNELSQMPLKTDFSVLIRFDNS